MKKFNYNVLNDELYYFKCDNGFKVYLLPNKMSKNFFISLGVNYGAEVCKYKVGNKTYEVTPGVAHFIEHRVADYSKDAKAEEIIRNLGSMPNACTTYLNTRYVIYGSTDIEDNLKILFDRVFKPTFKVSDIEKERGIILEECYMYDDNPSSKIYDIVCDSLYKKHYLKTPIIGLPNTINEIKKEEIERIYNDFYVPENMFLVITGNYDIDTVYEFVNKYMNKIEYKKYNAKKIFNKEPLEVDTTYKEVKLDVEEEKVAISLKCDGSSIKDISQIQRGYYVSGILNALFSVTSNMYEKYKENKLISTYFQTSRLIEDDFYDVKIIVDTENANDFINSIKKDLKKVKISKSDFERKKKFLLSEIILTFEDIQDANDFISYSVSKYDKPLLDYYDIVNGLNYEDALRVLNMFKTDNMSIVKITM